LCDIYIRYVSLPYYIDGVTLPNDDATFDVYINLQLCEEKQKETLQHELNHIRKNHFYDYNCIAINEIEANKVCVLVSI